MKAFVLVAVDKGDRRDACLLSLCNLEQLFPNSAMSPDDAGDHGIRIFPLFVGQLGAETELPFYLPVYLG